MPKYYTGNIKVDIDHKSVFELTMIRAAAMKLHLIKKTETKKGWHFFFRSERRLTETEAILIQLLLGSDSKREFLNYMRICNGARLKDWNILFTHKRRKI